MLVTVDRPLIQITLSPSSGSSLDFILFASPSRDCDFPPPQALCGSRLIGLGTIAVYKILFTEFSNGPGVPGFLAQVAHEWVTLANLLGLLTGFALPPGTF